MYAPLAEVDYTVNDPALLDPEFPPEHFVTHFISEGSAVQAMMWIAQGAAPKGCVVLIPQVNGGENLESLIIPLMASGIHVLKFHPRGMWDTEHTYSKVSALEDVHAAVRYLQASTGLKTRRGKSYRLDPERIAVLGLSGGGGTIGLAACAENPSLKYGIAIAAANLELVRPIEGVAPAGEPFDPWDSMREVTRATAGRVDTVRMLKSMSQADFDRFSILQLVPQLLSKTLLLIGASGDNVMPIEVGHKELVRAFHEAGANRFTEAILETDHMFLTKRIALARLVISWLRTECEF